MTKIYPEKIAHGYEMEDGQTRVRPIKSLIVCSFGFMLIFISFISMVNLLSSISVGEGFGTASLAVLFAALIFSSLVLTPYVIRLLGLKLTITISALLFAPYTAANFYPSWYTFIPTAVIIGVAAATLWSAASVYVTTIAKIYAAKIKKDEKTVIFVFFGIFMTFFQSANIWGNFLSYEILKPSGDEPHATNLSFDHQYHLCGVYFCDAVAAESHQTDIDKPDAIKFFILTGVMTGISVLAALTLAFFLQPIPDNAPKMDVGVWREVSQTVQRFKMPYHILLVPITIYSGVEAAFWQGEFTKAYIACSCGVHKIGLVAIVFGVMNTLGSLGLGLLTRYVHRVFIITTICAISFGTVVALWIWEPSEDDTLVFFVFAGIWGMCDSVFQAQTRALYGVLFQDNQEAAFSLHTCLGGVGQMMSFSYSTKLCIAPKLYILGGLMLISVASYLTVEIDVRRKTNKVKSEFVTEDDRY